jgi:hypothetical protein
MHLFQENKRVPCLNAASMSTESHALDRSKPMRLNGDAGLPQGEDGGLKVADTP